MQPHELVRALVQERTRTGKSLTEMACEMHKRSFQGTLHKFIHGLVREPSRTTAERIAHYFKLPLEAVYSERVATAEAARLGLSEAAPTAPVEEVRFLREPSSTYNVRPALSPRLSARLQQLSPPQLEALERIIHAHLDALQCGTCS